MRVRACGLVIFRRYTGTIQYLLMQTSYGKHHWTPPKGHVDKGESDMETALRETEEEAGLLKDDFKIFENVKHEMKYNVEGQLKTVVYWLAELIKQKEVKMSDEHQDFAWLPIDDACKRTGYPEMQECLREFDKYIVDNLN